MSFLRYHKQHISKKKTHHTDKTLTLCWIYIIQYLCISVYLKRDFRIIYETFNYLVRFLCCASICSRSPGSSESGLWSPSRTVSVIFLSKWKASLSLLSSPNNNSSQRDRHFYPLIFKLVFVQ